MKHRTTEMARSVPLDFPFLAIPDIAALGREGSRRFGTQYFTAPFLILLGKPDSRALQGII